MCRHTPVYAHRERAHSLIKTAPKRVQKLDPFVSHSWKYVHLFSHRENVTRERIPIRHSKLAKAMHVAIKPLSFVAIATYMLKDSLFEKVQSGYVSAIDGRAGCFGTTKFNKYEPFHAPFQRAIDPRKRYRPQRTALRSHHRARVATSLHT